MYTYLFEIIESWFAKFGFILSEIKYIIMDLESNAQVSSKVKQIELVFHCCSSHEDTNASTPQ